MTEQDSEHTDKELPQRKEGFGHRVYRLGSVALSGLSSVFRVSHGNAEEARPERSRLDALMDAFAASATLERLSVGLASGNRGDVSWLIRDGAQISDGHLEDVIEKWRETNAEAIEALHTFAQYLRGSEENVSVDDLDDYSMHVRWACQSLARSVEDSSV